MSYNPDYVLTSLGKLCDNSALASAFLGATAAGSATNGTRMGPPHAAAAPEASSPSLTPSQLQMLLAAQQQRKVGTASNLGGQEARYSQNYLHEALSSILNQKEAQAEVARTNTADMIRRVTGSAAVQPPAGAQGEVSPLQRLLGQVVQLNDTGSQQAAVLQQETLLQPGSNLLEQVQRLSGRQPSPSLAGAAVGATGAGSSGIQSILVNLMERQKQQKEREDELRKAALQLQQQLLVQQQQQQQASSTDQNALAALLGLLCNQGSAETLQTGVQDPSAEAQTQSRPQVTPDSSVSLSPTLSFQRSSSNDFASQAISTTATEITSEIVTSEVTAAEKTPEKKRRRGRSGSFPQKIHQMLRDLEQQGRQDIASFVMEGNAFCIHRPKEFSKDVMPKYFKMGSYASFQRQLNLYSFQRVSEGPCRGSYRHDLFVKGKPLLSTTMKRKETKKSAPKRAQEARSPSFDETRGTPLENRED